jgi:hypothetical protein
MSVTATDPDGDTLTYAWTANGIPFGTNAPTYDFSRANPGIYTLRVVVSDGEESVSHEWIVTVEDEPSDVVVPWLWLLLIFVAIIIFLIILFWWRKRKKEEEEEEEVAAELTESGEPAPVSLPTEEGKVNEEIPTPEQDESQEELNSNPPSERGETKAYRTLGF